MSAMRSAADATGVSFDYLLRTARRESSLVPTAQATTSSARGLYQFIDQTWLTMVRDEGARFGLSGQAAQISTDANGRATVSDPETRRQILALRDDPTIAASMAAAFTQRNTTQLTSSIGRTPTEGELYMAHFLGAGGAGRLINANQSNPQASAARLFPEAADANQRIFFDRGRPRTVAEVYTVLAAGQSRPASPSQNTVGTLVSAQAAAPRQDFGTWGAFQPVSPVRDRAFHSLFSSTQPINGMVASVWGQIAPATGTGRPPAEVGSIAAAPVPVARATVGVGGPFTPLSSPGSNQPGPLDLGRFRRPPSGA